MSCVLLAVVALSACANGAGPLQQVTTPPEGDPYIEGEVTQVEQDPPSILVVEPGGGNQAMLRITGETQLLKEFGGGFEPAALPEVRQGQTVAVWVGGPVAQSFPVQANADAVVIRE